MIKRKIFDNDPKKWAEGGGKGELTTSIEKALEEAQRQYREIENQEKVNAIYEKLHGSELNPVRSGLNYFSWQGSDEQLKKLYEGLIAEKAGFIDSQKNDFPTFTAIFSGSAIDTNLQRVTWIKLAKNGCLAKNSVIHLFKLLAESERIPKAVFNRKLFKRLEACFCDRNGKAMTFETAHCNYPKENADTLQDIISSL